MLKQTQSQSSKSQSQSFYYNFIRADNLEWIFARFEQELEQEGFTLKDCVQVLLHIDLA